jgi:hypothetical protein
MTALTFAERYAQAKLYAAQVRVRRAMGEKYAHAVPWRGPDGLKDRSEAHVACNRRR